MNSRLRMVAGNSILVFLALCAFSIAYGQRILKTESGVSESMAIDRASSITALHYHLDFMIPAERTGGIAAKELVQFKWKKHGQGLALDFREETDHLKEVLVNGKPLNIETSFINEHIKIPLDLLKDGANTISINFQAGELSLNRNDDYLYTLLVPDRARTVFPCFDQPDLKARFTLSLTLPTGWQAMANAPLKDSVLAGNQKTYHYKTSDLFSTYLFSFVAGNFRESERRSGRPYHFYYRETDSNKIRLSIDTIYAAHDKAISFLEAYTQIKFPFQKLDYVAIPDFQYGGMEHVGAIDYKSSSLFLDSGATREQQNGRASLIAHETSHMWFGDLVTMRWFNDVWMKEVFANFMADKITQGNSQGYELRFMLTHMPRAYAVDRTAGANPIRQQLNNLQEAGNLYGAIIYDKAPVMMRQLEQLMGPIPFRDGLREYLKKYSFSNATWPDLINILDRRTPADLQAWNKVWVNTPGRPVINYSVDQQAGIIDKLVITQKGEQSDNYLLPQFFKLALVYSNRVEEYKVNMNKDVVEMKELKGKPMPLFFLFNSSGEGYGLFPVDQHQDLSLITNSLMRASAFINLYENMLSGNDPHPLSLLDHYLKIISTEKEELILSLIIGQVNDIYWHLISPEKRNSNSERIGKEIWYAMNVQSEPNKKKILFRSYQNLALGKEGLERLYNIWKSQLPPTGVRLTEDDYTSLALNLVLKQYPEPGILETQLSRITNTDRKQRLQFLKPAVSADVKERDAFFSSLQDQKVRKKESLVAEALGYLHHPLHAESSVKYLQESLNMLELIQRTGDIFFPGAWLNASFSAYQTKEAADIVRNFLKTNPGYNSQLRLKILQAADPLFRAEHLVKQED